MFKQTFFIFVLILSGLIVTSLSYSAEAEKSESLTITTYYPSPSGVYRTLRLHPSNEPTAGVSPGLMYYNQTENVVKIRNATAWVNMTGAGSSGGTVIVGNNPVCPAGQMALMKAYNGTWYVASQPAAWNLVSCGQFLSSDGTEVLVNGQHTKKDCNDANGVLTSIGSAGSVCMFNAGVCPGPWQKYYNWTTTVGVRCSAWCSAIGQSTKSCAYTPNHAWGNVPLETATLATYRCSPSGGGWCDCLALGTCCAAGGTWPQCVGCESCTATSTITQIGCY